MNMINKKYCNLEVNLINNLYSSSNNSNNDNDNNVHSHSHTPIYYSTLAYDYVMWTESFTWTRSCVCWWHADHFHGFHNWERYSADCPITMLIRDQCALLNQAVLCLFRTWKWVCPLTIVSVLNLTVKLDSNEENWTPRWRCLICIFLGLFLSALKNWFHVSDNWWYHYVVRSIFNNFKSYIPCVNGINCCK
jgi:hypothetical protein